ncbi:TonB-dependent receptor [Carboxylicivirga mesophila]|uniref:TonB-dependent receptor n=1 Tax=Carboxylicivirga mesophila TaxID=1166478 RepID=A0ABS5KBI7_9BACT|nr:TonB-dependent receptor [Carboxylicivirga mesophila]MBS2212314.1 TonB-dependent receptor [Carboxylicivirga mesophila]
MRCKLLIIFLVLSLPVWADGEVHDSVKVEEVVVTGHSISRFQAGSKIEKVSKDKFLSMQDGNLEQLLLRYTPISVKGMAGSFSTIRLRGTSPDHTSINFGGININSLTLGHSNVSNVPMYLFDEIGLQYGSASVVNGSGSIGGAIHLGMQNYWVDGLKAEVRVANGSFGEQLYGTKLFYGNGKWEGVTRAYIYSKTNNFKFYNTTHDFNKGEAFGEDIQRNAAIDNKGVIQEFNHRFNSNSALTVKAWFENDWHEIQQNMQTNAFQPSLSETLEDEHVRIWSEYSYKQQKLSYQVGAGYVYDNSIHNKTVDNIATQRITGRAEGEYKFDANKGLKAGLSLKSIYPDVYAYDSGLNNENWTDIYLSYFHSLFNKLTITLNIRQAFVTNFTVPLTPAMGLSYNAISGDSYVWSFTGNIASSYRVPTFNDRYWVPGGNPDLKPEDGINYELGTKISYCTERLSGHVKLNAFYLDVDNWLQWVNGDNGWEAQNIQRVLSRGIELSSDLNWVMGQYTFNTGLNYTYNPVVRKESTDGQQVAVGRQLEYVPLHRGVLYLNGQHRKISAGIDASYTHKQYISLQESTIPEVVLVNAQVGYQFHLDTDNLLRISGSFNNLMNKDYQSSYGYPMPRANYRISITYNFK